MTTTSGDTAVVRAGCASDAAGCHELLKRVLLSPDAREDEGFLIADATIDDFRVLLSRTRTHVAEHHGQIVGFVVAFLTESLEFLSLRDLLGDPQWSVFVQHAGPGALYVDRVAVDPAYRHGGIGRRLYESLFVDRPDTVVALLVEEPIRNRASIAFHIALGFRRVGTLRLDEYRGLRPFVNGIYVRNTSSV